MKSLTTAVVLLAVLLLGIGVAGLSTADPVPDRLRIETGVERSGMLESDMAMLERMRVDTSPVMMTMIQEDRMWTDPDMIRAQEEYQAQLDRMLGKRPGP